MRHKEIRTIDLPVGVWRHMALKCGRFFLWVGKTSEKGSLPVHISSAGLFLLAHPPIQARSASDQRLQTTNTKTIFTSCQNSRPLTTRTEIITITKKRQAPLGSASLITFCFRPLSLFFTSQLLWDNGPRAYETY